MPKEGRKPDKKSSEPTTSELLEKDVSEPLATVHYLTTSHMPYKLQTREIGWHIPQRFRDSTFANFDLERNPKMRDARDRCRAVAAGLASMVFLHGDRGLGKTHLAVAAVEMRRACSCPADFWEVPELLAYLRHCVAGKEHVDVEDAIRNFGVPDLLLVLDDLGVENPTDWANEQLYRILNRRYAEGGPTIITSNVPRDKIDPRIRSRFREGVIACEGKDQRGR